MANLLAKHLPVVGSMYGFTLTAVEVYNSISIAGGSKTAIKGILVSCTPPKLKYSPLCSAFTINGIVCVDTGFNPVAVSVFVSNGRLIVEK